LSLFKIAILSLMFFILPLSESKASEGSTYQFKWLDQDKEVFVLQNRKYRKKNRLHLMLGLGATTSGAFSSATLIQGRAGYFIGEEWVVELLYSKNNSDTNDSFNGVVQTGQVTPFVRLTRSYIGGMLLWSPFYAKINTFNNIIYFDWIFGLGAASVTEENNITTIDTTTVKAFEDPTKETHTAIMWDVGVQFYLSRNWALRVDFTAHHYNAPEALGTNSLSSEEDINSNYDLTVSAAVRF